MVYQRVADRRRNDADKKAKENERLQREAFKLRNKGYWVSDIARTLGKPEAIVLNLLKNDEVKPETATHIQDGGVVKAVHIHSYHWESVRRYIDSFSLTRLMKSTVTNPNYDWLVIGTNRSGLTYALTYSSEEFYREFSVGRN